MTRISLFVRLGITGLGLLASAHAQSTVAPRSASGAIPPDVLARLAAAQAQARAQAVAQGPAGAETAPAVDPQTKERLDLLKKIQFDRRPSTVLATWAGPPPKGVDEDPELKLPEKPQALIDAEAKAAAEKAAADEAAAGKADTENTESETRATPEPATTPAQRAEPDPPGGEGYQAVSAGGDSSEASAEKAAADKAAADKAAADKAAADKAAAELAKLKAEFEAKTKEVETKRFQRQLELLQRAVTLGDWPAVGAFLAAFPEPGRVDAYDHLLTSLANAPQPQQRNQRVPPQFLEANAFGFDDVLALAGLAPPEPPEPPKPAGEATPSGGESAPAGDAAAPGPRIGKDRTAKLAPMLQRALDTGHAIEEWLERLRAEVARPPAEQRLDRRRAALLLVAIGREVETGEFLPTIAAAAEADDREALNLLARHALAQHAAEQKTEHLERAWEATQAALAAGEIDEKDKAEALRRAVDLAPRIRDELGAAWLDESFTKRPERGMEILATIGGAASTALVDHATDVEFRKKGLQLQKTALDALLREAPELGGEWRPTLGLLADVWLREARHSYETSDATSLGQIMRFDSFGNPYYYSYGRGNTSPVTPIDPGDLLDVRPAGLWLELLDSAVKPRLHTTFAELYLKVNEEAEAFPYIESLAKTHPEQATELANEFIRVWIRNHDPNSDRNRTSAYLFSYGFNTRASGIPLTRSKQDRNLEDLGRWVAKLRAVPIEDIDQHLLMKAFASSHSSAEVYRLETIEAVFGGFDELEPEVVAEAVQAMRANLASVWRRPDVQEAAKTRRKQKDIEREVLRGYEVARGVLGTAIAAHPDEWSLRVADAALAHDENNYRRELGSSTEFAQARLAALERFCAAAELYAAGLPDRALDDETSAPYESWFYAALGASDLSAVDDRTVLAAAEPARIRAALTALPGEASERHLARFANALFTRMSSVNPAIKFRYLQAGFEIVGDHPKAREAQKIYDYYNDLVTEVRLDVRVDGSSDVGDGAFGVYIDLVHTREIERESGGFAKYLQNQNNQPYAYNYGRPTENYRDKFEEAARAALAEHFEVQSVTFNGEDAYSKAAEDYGWRRTPYAYALLKARGPEIDRIPSLKLDLDFLDTTGYVVLPAVSPVVPIDASGAAEPRPYEDLEITQILDERKAAEGTLSLEIKAQARGLVPELDTLVDVAPADFEVASVEDRGVAVSSFDEEQDRVLSERIWIVAMTARESLAEGPRTFRFPAARDDGAKTVFQRYDDADLVTANAEVDLLARYGEGGWSAWWLAGIAAVLLAGGLGWSRLRRRPPAAETRSLRMPERVDAFTVLALLREILRSGGLDPTGREELARTIAVIERHFFGKVAGEEPDLGRIAAHWLQRAS